MEAKGTDIDEERFLVYKLKNGDVKAFEQLYNLYKRPVASVILKLVKSSPIAEDLVHDLFIKVWTQREHLDPERAFGGYLYRVSGNMVMDFFRKAAQDNKFRSHIFASIDPGYSHVEEVLENKEKQHLLNEAIAILPPQCRLVFTLCKIEGKSSEEVASELNVSPHTISNHLAKASKLIRKFLILHVHDAATFSLLFFLANTPD